MHQREPGDGADRDQAQRDQVEAREGVAEGLGAPGQARRQQHARQHEAHAVPDAGAVPAEPDTEEHVQRVVEHAEIHALQLDDEGEAEQDAGETEHHEADAVAEPESHQQRSEEHDDGVDPEDVPEAGISEEGQGRGELVERLVATQQSAEGRQAVPEVALEAPHAQAPLDRRHPGGARPRRVHELDHEPEHEDEDRGGSPGELLDVEGIGAHPIENFRVRQRVGEEREDHGEGASEVDEMQSRQIQPHDIPILHSFRWRMLTNFLTLDPQPHDRGPRKRFHHGDNGSP